MQGTPPAKQLIQLFQTFSSNFKASLSPGKFFKELFRDN